MKRLIQLCIANTFTINLIAFAIVLFGGWTLYNMKRDLIPPLEFPHISVSASLSGASPSEIEYLVTYPIEEAIKSIPEIKKMTSTSYPGGMRIDLSFHAADTGKLRDIEAKVDSLIDGIADRLPLDMKPVRVQREEVSDIYLADLAVKNVDPLNSKHRTAVHQLQTQITSIPGIVRVDSSLPARDLYVRLDAQKIANQQMDLKQVRAAILEYVDQFPVGHISRDGSEYSIRLDSNEINPENLSEVPVRASTSGRVVRIGDVAKVQWDTHKNETKWLWNGVEVVSFTVYKNTLADSITLFKELRSKTEELQTTLPKPLVLEERFDGPRFITKQIDVLVQNGWLGLLIVFLLLMVFIGTRPAFMTVAGLPVCYLGTFLVLSWIGISIDLLSILGILLVVGILVDDAIVISERYSSLLEAGLSPDEAARVSAQELFVPISGTILTTIVAFLPIILIKDNLTWFLSAIPLVVITSMCISWAESLFILPNHLAHFVKHPPRIRGSEFLKKAIGIFTLSLEKLMRFRYAVLAAVVLIAGIVLYVAANKMQHHFNISVGSEQIWVFAELKNSEGLKHTEAAIRPIIEYLQTFPKEQVEFTSTRIGSSFRGGESQKGYRYAQIVAGINGNADSPVQIREDLMPIIQEGLKKLKTDRFQVLTSEERKRGEESFNKNTFNVRVEGTDHMLFRKVEANINKVAENLKGISAKKSQDDLYMQQWSFQPDLDKLREYDLTRADLAAQLRTFLDSHSLGYIRSNGDSAEVLIEMQESGYEQLDTLQNLPILLVNGQSIPVTWLGEWEQSRVRQSIDHKSGVRYLDLPFEFDEAKYNMNSAMAAFEKKAEPIFESFPRLNFTIENANEHETENKSWILEVLMYSFVGVLLVLALFTQSLTKPFLVMTPAPLGMLGSLAMLQLHGMPLTIMAMVGLLGVIGVAVNDSIVLLHYLDRLNHSLPSISAKERILMAAKSRFRAIMLTSVTTLAGLFPTAYGLFGESGFTQPIVFSMAWGLTISTLSTLYLLPCFLLIREDILDRIRGARAKLSPVNALLRRRPREQRPDYTPDLDI